MIYQDLEILPVMCLEIQRERQPVAAARSFYVKRNGERIIQAHTVAVAKFLEVTQPRREFIAIDPAAQTQRVIEQPTLQSGGDSNDTVAQAQIEVRHQPGPVFGLIGDPQASLRR